MSSPAAPQAAAKNITIVVLALAVVTLLLLLVFNPPGYQTQSTRASIPSAEAEPHVQDEAAEEAAAAESYPEPEPNPEYEEFLLSLAERVEADPMAKGDVDAPVVLIQWADYQCGYCQRFATQTGPFLESYVADGTLRIEYRDLAIFGDESAMVAAAARAAGEQDLFWQYHDAAYEALVDGEVQVSDEFLAGLAEEVGIPDLAQWEATYQSAEIREAVAESSQVARDLGITSTPTFVIGGEVVMGAQPLSTFQLVIERQLHRLQ